METKQSIRKEIYRIRKETDIRKIKIDSHLICDQILHHSAFLEAKTVYVYMELEKEVCMEELTNAAWRAGKVVAVPKVVGDDLHFYEITSCDQVKEGFFGVREPIEGCKRSEEEQVLMILPGVAFDKNRHRLGYGRGFYDRYLKEHPKHTTIAVGFDFQVIDQVPQDSFDVVPQMLVTQSCQYM
jgi:5-formyltetrahydrofolate cyclo-ligase